MVGVQHRPALPEGRRAPGVLFLHGFPGSEKNVDIQRALMERGVASFAPHFAGAWGSGGTYRYSTLVDQARTALAVLSRLDHVDPRRLAVFGFSMGGWTAINLAARAPGLRGVVAVAPVGGPEMVTPETARFLEKMSKPLNAPGGHVLTRDFAVSARACDPAKAVARLPCPLLLVHGTEDDVVPYAVSRRLAAIAGARAELVTAKGGEHSFLDRRPWLTRVVMRWLFGRLDR